MSSASFTPTEVANFTVGLASPVLLVDERDKTVVGCSSTLVKLELVFSDVEEIVFDEEGGMEASFDNSVDNKLSNSSRVMMGTSQRKAELTRSDLRSNCSGVVIRYDVLPFTTANDN